MQRPAAAAHEVLGRAVSGIQAQLDGELQQSLAQIAATGRKRPKALGDRVCRCRPHFGSGEQ